MQVTQGIMIVFSVYHDSICKGFSKQTQISDSLGGPFNNLFNFNKLPILNIYFSKILRSNQLVT